MAAVADSRRASVAHSFNAGQWLANFADVGGWWIVGGDNRISLGWMIEGYSIAENAAAAVLWREAKADPDKMAAIRDHLLAGSLGRPAGDQSRVFHIADELSAPCGHRLTTFVELSEIRAPTRDPARRAWDRAMAAFQTADTAEDDYRESVFRAADQTHIETGEAIPNPVRTQMRDLEDATDAALAVLFALPAPDAAALRFKLDYLIENAETAAWLAAGTQQLTLDVETYVGGA